MVEFTAGKGLRTSRKQHIKQQTHSCSRAVRLPRLAGQVPLSLLLPSRLQADTRESVLCESGAFSCARTGS